MTTFYLQDEDTPPEEPEIPEVPITPEVPAE